MREAGAILEQWGYRSVLSGEHRLRGVFSQALLINRSPRLEDLDTAAFGRLHAHPATNAHLGQMLYALQRAVAALGHCEPPVRTGYNHAPGIDGTDAAWASWVQRWHDTSTLTPKVRAIVRTIMAKAGRWLALEHPEITEPGQWTRQTCVAWVAAVDRMAVGDYVQRRDHIHARAGTPISPRTKAHNLMATRTFFRDLQEWEWIGRRFDPARALAVPPQRCRADRHQPACYRRRRLGETAVGRAQPRARRPARQHRRHLLPDGTHPGRHPELAVQWPAQ
jgi:hypothetical protein